MVDLIHNLAGGDVTKELLFGIPLIIFAAICKVFIFPDEEEKEEKTENEK